MIVFASDCQLTNYCGTLDRYLDTYLCIYLLTINHSLSSVQSMLLLRPRLHGKIQLPRPCRLDVCLRSPLSIIPLPVTYIETLQIRLKSKNAKPSSGPPSLKSP